MGNGKQKGHISARGESLRAAAVARAEFATVRQMYGKGYSTIEIGAAYGVGNGAIGRILTEGGVQLRTGQESMLLVRARRRTENSKKGLNLPNVFYLYHSKGMSCRQIAGTIGVNPETVRRFMKKHKISRRSKEAGQRLRISQEKKRGVAMGNTAVTTRGATINLLDEKKVEREEVEKASYPGKGKIDDLKAERVALFERLTHAEVKVGEKVQERTIFDDDLRTRKFAILPKKRAKLKLELADTELQIAEEEKSGLEKKLIELDHKIVECEALARLHGEVEAIGHSLASVKLKLRDLWDLLAGPKN